MSRPIEDYALIGNLCTTALVDRDGSIDWLCVPRFDSAACFASILGDDKNGRWLLAPQGEIKQVRRRYSDHTLILETEFVTDSGAVTVRGRTRGGCVTIAIEDNGIGIPKDALHKLGRPFEQVESQLTKRHQGSGLGLAIAKSLAELHGGRMRIRSVLGAGTMVVVRLPLHAREPVPEAEAPRCEQVLR